ncbi:MULTISPECIES: hypothetical protein [unclassified Phycicoccus]|uniref:hypothetical protein n=1 Tax=unclassified Phycicoccus TaxID=2637926 RepID=UPI000ACB848F|nr:MULTISPECIES: hypothetical protein [unclassified Phycicoccus]
MRLVARFVAVAGLVLAGGLALPGGAAQAAACSNTTGVTVVIDYGSSSSTLCAADDTSAMKVLKKVATVVSPVQYPGTVVCKINSVPSDQSCQRMPPASAYWAFFHAPRGGSWTYSSSGVADYDPAPGSVIGFAFGSGGAPSSPPPAKAAPKPSPSPSPSSSSSRPPAPKPKPASTTPPRPSSSSSSAGAKPGTTSAAGSVTRPGPRPSTTAPGSTTTTAPSGTTTGTTPSTDSTGDGANAAAARADSTDSGSPTTLLAGLGLVGLVGAGAAYLAIRRRAAS